MAPAYTWHPPHRPRRPRWTLPVTLLADESLSSWLVRAALAHGCEPAVLAGWLWPGTRIWTTDVDRGIAAEDRAVLARASGIETEAIDGGSLAPIVDRLLDGDPPPQGRWPWILTLGARGARRSGGSQYCPACLEEDETPHLRVQWRLAWHTACERHGLRLLDRCPKCPSALKPHRLGADARHLARCAACGADLQQTTAAPCADGALALQRAADAVASNGEGKWLGTPASAAAWLASAAFLARLVRRATRAPTRALKELLAAAECGAVRAGGRGAGTSIEQMAIEDRASVLDAVAQLMALGPTGLRGALKTSGLTREGWCERGDTLPEPLASIGAELPESASAGAKNRRRRRRSGPRPRHEVRQMMVRLERTAELGRR